MIFHANKACIVLRIESRSSMDPWRRGLSQYVSACRSFRGISLSGACRAQSLDYPVNSSVAWTWGTESGDDGPTSILQHFYCPGWWQQRVRRHTWSWTCWFSATHWDALALLWLCFVESNALDCASVCMLLRWWWQTPSPQGWDQWGLENQGECGIFEMSSARSARGWCLLLFAWGMPWHALAFRGL